jgi:hypothetical protein
MSCLLVCGAAPALLEHFRAWHTIACVVVVNVKCVFGRRPMSMFDPSASVNSTVDKQTVGSTCLPTKIARELHWSALITNRQPNIPLFTPLILHETDDAVALSAIRALEQDSLSFSSTLLLLPLRRHCPFQATSCSRLQVIHNGKFHLEHLFL